MTDHAVDIDRAPLDTGDLVVIERPYALVTTIPCYIDDRGEVWLERSWHHDVLEHLTYLKNFILCAPQVPWHSGPDLVRFNAPSGTHCSFAYLPPQTSFLRAFLNIPGTIIALWRVIGKVQIVHSGIGGWPYPLGWIANPVAVLLGKRLVIVVESDWLSGPDRQSWLHRLIDMNPLRNWMARWSCNHASLALFTQSHYRDALRTRDLDRAYVTPAVWVNDENILEIKLAESVWAEKVHKPARLLFAGRLALSKGIEVLLSVLRLLDERGIEVAVDIIGQGEQKDSCIRCAAKLRSVRLSVLEPVPYGKPFFELLSRYHALIVPSLGNEQPRVVFDANAQAVPVIASDTDGLRPHVEHGKTGWLLPVGDVDALASLIARASSEIPQLRTMGLAALRATHGVTHKAMHRRRSQLLQKHCV